MTDGTWCWACATGWNYYFPEYEITPEQLALGVRKKLGGYGQFHPNEDPGEIIAKIRAIEATLEKLCEQCSVTFTLKQKTARFCSDKCRVYSNRKQLRNAVA
jgi:hypothetical protein